MSSNLIINGSDTFNTEILIPGDKSITHRAIMIGSLSSGTCKITNYLQSDDCLNTIDVFKNLGVSIQTDDNVVIINAEKIKLTGKKLDDKTYYRHTGYPGGIKSINARKILEGQFPDRIVRLAVKRMIPKGPLGRKQLSNMKVYIGDKHPHEAQNPKIYNIRDVV